MYNQARLAACSGPQPSVDYPMIWNRIAVAGLLAGLLLCGCRPADRPTAGIPSPPANDKIRVTAPVAQAIVQSPLTVSGTARGTWYFEASFPVRLVDSDGKELAIAPAQAKGEWMTTEFAPFEVVLIFGAPTTPTGMLVLQKDNPSGLPEHADSIVIPVRFR